jgi:hypothetical protein
MWAQQKELFAIKVSIASRPLKQVCLNPWLLCQLPTTVLWLISEMTTALQRQLTDKELERNEMMYAMSTIML